MSKANPDTEGRGGDRVSTAAKLTAKEKQKKALELRLAGVTYQQIAEAVGYSNPSVAHRAVKSALDAIPKEAAESLRDMELARLDEMQMRLVARFRTGDLEVTNKIIRVMEHRAKLTGAYQLPEGAGDMTSVATAFAGLLASAQAFAATSAEAFTEGEAVT